MKWHLDTTTCQGDNVNNKMKVKGEMYGIGKINN